MNLEKIRLLSKELFSNLFFILFIGLLARIIVSFSLIGGLHADEQFQGLEMAYNLLYPSSKNIIPWEFATKTRSYIIPLLLVPVVYLSPVLNIVGLPYFTLMRFLLSLISLSFIPLAWHLFDSNDNLDKSASLLVSWFFALYLPYIFFTNYIGADGFALLLLIFLLFYVSNEKNREFSKNKYFLIGLVISILISFRLQFAIIFLPYILSSLKKKSLYTFYGLFIGSIPLLTIDYIFYGFPGITIINFFVYNVVNQKNVSLVPETFWWLYVVLVPVLLLYVGLGFPIIFFNYTKGYHYSKNTTIRLMALGAIIYIIFFQYLTYKEVRFVIPAIVVILFDSFQSLPPFLVYLRKIKHQKFVKVYAVLLLLSIPISFIIAPYNYDMKDNLWLAQEQVRQLDPQATIGIIDPFQMTGGYFFQYGGKTNASIYFMDQMTIQELNNTFHIITYFINDQNHVNYTLITQLKNSICKVNTLVKEFTYLRQWSLDKLNYEYNPDKLGVKIELWRCN